jgi:hypothetical protein
MQPGLSKFLVTPATNMWYINYPKPGETRARYFAVCAAHSLLTTNHVTHTNGDKVVIDSRLPLKKMGKHRFDFRVSSDFAEKPSPTLDFAFAQVDALPDDNEAMMLAPAWAPPRRLVMLFQSRFDLDGARLSDCQVAAVDATVSPYTSELYMIQDAGFPGFSGAAAVEKVDDNKQLRLLGLFVAVAKPVLPKSFSRQPAATRHPEATAPVRPAAAASAAPSTRRPPGLLRQAVQDFLGISALDKKIDEKVDQLRSEVHQVRSEVHQLQSEVHQLQSKVLTKSDIFTIVAATQRRWGVLVPSSSITNAIDHAEAKSIAVTKLLGTETDPKFWSRFAEDVDADEMS